MTLILSEKDVESLLAMDELVPAVEDAFRNQGRGQASNFMRTRSKGKGSVQSVMHANLFYLGRGGLKAYISTPGGTKFVVLLFSTADPTLLAVMGADMLGRFRTGAASGVATKHLYRKKSGVLALMGSGRQALTQATAVRSVMKVDEVRVWSPVKSHREEFASRLGRLGFAARASSSPAEATRGADVVSTITSSKEPFLTGDMLDSVSHVNIAGGNVPDHSEMSADALGSFGTVVVDDLPQAKDEYGDLIQAVDGGTFDWNSAKTLASVIAGETEPSGRTLFKSGGVALEDVAAASLIYDKAVKSGRKFSDVSLV